MSLGWTEALVILLVILLLFGAKKIPEIARSIARATYEFKKARREVEQELKEIKENEAEEDASKKDK